jgi:hypothetical protein
MIEVFDEETPSLQIDNCLYTIEPSQASAHPDPTADSFLPRNIVSHAGLSLPVSSLCNPADPWSSYPSVQFTCIPSSVQTLPKHFFSGWAGLIYLAFEANTAVSVFLSSLFDDCVSLRSICVP